MDLDIVENKYEILKQVVLWFWNIEMKLSLFKVGCKKIIRSSVSIYSYILVSFCLRKIEQ